MDDCGEHLTFEAFYVEVFKAYSCVRANNVRSAKTIKVVHYQRYFLCPACLSSTQKRGNLSGAFAQNMTVCRFSIYENKCWRVLNWLGCSGDSQGREMALRADRPTRLVCIEMHDAVLHHSPLSSLCGPLVAARGVCMAVGAELRQGQLSLTANTACLLYQYSTVMSAHAALMLQTSACLCFGLSLHIFWHPQFCFEAVFVCVNVFFFFPVTHKY